MSREDEIEGLIRAVVADYRATSRRTGLREPGGRVLDALRRVPRDAFVPEPERPWAWRNTALPIGLGQTISQPYIVALMSDLLEVEPGSRVLEIGTGCGYQAAVLAELGASVHSMEIVEELAAGTVERLARLGYAGVEVRVGDGGGGWPELAPFDRIIATAAASQVPVAWFDQLGAGGRMVAPVGAAPGAQVLRVWTRQPDGVCDERTVLAVRFVPLTGRDGG